MKKYKTATMIGRTLTTSTDAATIEPNTKTATIRQQ